MLIVRGDRGAIGYYSAHSVMRRRFTIAHDISHFLLHARRNRTPQFFADKHVLFRPPGDGRASHVCRRDAEANQFGATLLMPRSAILKEIEFHDSDLDDEEAIKYLCEPISCQRRCSGRKAHEFAIIAPLTWCGRIDHLPATLASRSLPSTCERATGRCTGLPPTSSVSSRLLRCIPPEHTLAEMTEQRLGEFLARKGTDKTIVPKPVTA